MEFIIIIMNSSVHSTVVLICLLDSQMKHVEERFGPDTNKEVLLMCIGITSGVGRLIFGRVADYVDGVNKVYLQVILKNLKAADVSRLNF